MNYSMENRKNKNAFAFSITLWIVASLLLATVVILRFAKDEVSLSRALNNKLQTQVEAKSVLEALKFYVPTAKLTSTSLKNGLLENFKYPFPLDLIVDGREYNLSKNITISLEDISGLQNLIYAPANVVAKVLTTQQNEAFGKVLEASLKDWRDQDNVVHVNGAEQSSYAKRGEYFKVRNNSAIQDIHELTIINGFKNVNFNMIEENFTLGRGAGMNLMLIKNRRYLAHILNVDENFVSRLLELRKSEPKKFKKTVESLDGFDDDYMGFWLSKHFRIVIKVTKGKAKTVLKANVSFKPHNNRQYITHFYKLN